MSFSSHRRQSLHACECAMAGRAGQVTCRSRDKDDAKAEALRGRSDAEDAEDSDRAQLASGRGRAGSYLYLVC